MTAILCETCGSPVKGNLCPGCMFQMALTSDPDHEIESAPALPRYFADHEIIGEIARGGMGVVYRARKIGLDRPVALKIVRTGSLATPDARMRFTLEVEAISKLRHPHIITLFETGEADDVHYFSMPLAEGTLTRSEDLHSDVLIFKKVVSAVHHAHSRGILHRDIKPTNILIDANGEPLLSDFGLVKHLGQDSTTSMSRTIVGSPGYMAPEQKKSGTLSTAADIYSLGAVLYELLTGEPPSESSFAPDPRRKNPKVPKDLSAICQRCLEPQPTERYASAAILEQDLDSWLEGRPVLARSRSAAASAWLWARRNPGIAIMAAVCSCLLIALAIGATLAALRISQAQELATSRLQNLQLEEIENLETSGRTIDSISRLADYVEDYPSDQITRGHLLSALGHRSFPVNVETETRRLSGQFRAAVWNPHLVTLDGNGKLVEWLDPLRNTQLPRNKMALLNESASQALLVDENDQIIHWQRDGKPNILSELPFPLDWTASEDWTRLATIDSRRTLSIWSLPAGNLLKSKILNRRFRDLTFSPNGEFLAGGTADGHLMLWDAENLSSHELVYENWRNFSALTFSHDSSLLATGDQLGGIQIYTIPDGAPLTRPMRHGHGIHDLDFSDDDAFLVSASQTNSARIWQVATGKAHGQDARTSTGVRAVRFLDSEDGLRLGTIAHDGVLGEFKMRRPWLASTPQEFTSRVDRITQYNTVHYPMSATIFHAPSHPEVEEYLGLPWRAAVHPDGRHAAKAKRTGEVEIWDVHEKKQLHTLTPPGGITLSLSFSGPLLATATQNGKLGIWDWKTGKKTIPQPTLLGRATELTFSPDGTNYLVSNSRRLTIFETATANILWDKRHSNFLLSARYSPDGKQVVVSGSDGTAIIWEIENDRPPRILNHHAPLFHAAFSPCGRFILTASYQNTVRLWEAESGRPLTIPILIPGKLTGAGFHENGSQIVTTSAGGTFQTWDFPQKGLDSPLRNLARVLSEKTPAKRQDARDALLDTTNHDLVRWILSREK